ncbi:MAG TPA: DUF2796 domain-containing protein [Nitrosospira sp.]|jgi:hypothetical protein|nr:DUF2796 domain-containing protein [Nitrosospira sp.]
MISSSTAIIAVVMAFAWGGSAWAHSPGAHVHGLAALEIAIDIDTVHVNLITPLNNLVGFEHAPGNEKQRQAVKSMASKLHRAEDLFILTPAAQCRLTSVKLESPALSPELLMPVPSVGKSIDTNAGGTGNASRTELHDVHGELEAAWQFQCSNPQALQGMDVKLFQTFPGLQRLDAAVASPKGQASASLSPKSTQVRW